LATANWRFPDVICGHADPMHFAADLDIEDRFFAQIDRIELVPMMGESELCG